mmetsp:Transcript_56479/g.132479  ORF Transcript_56479/g.132479 Transcript_56479/m.132479 type:complete len:80 (+) Transcript_56479:409-648(+)
MGMLLGDACLTFLWPHPGAATKLKLAGKLPAKAATAALASSLRTIRVPWRDRLQVLSPQPIMEAVDSLALPIRKPPAEH